MLLRRNLLIWAFALLTVVILVAPNAASSSGCREGCLDEVSSSWSARGLPKLANGFALAIRPARVYGWTFSGTQILGGKSSNPPSGYEPGDFGRINWRAWTQRRAFGRGVVWSNDCEPSCGSGAWSGEPTRVSAYRVRSGHFTRMKFVCLCRGSRPHAIFGYRDLEPPQWEILRQWRTG